MFIFFFQKKSVERMKDGGNKALSAPQLSAVVFYLCISKFDWKLL